MSSLFDAIVDELAEQGYSIADGFLSVAEVKDILSLDNFKNGFEQFKKAGIGKNQGHHINETIRGDYIQWIAKDSAPPSLRVYLNRLDHLMHHINQTLFLSLKDYEVHIALYPPGTFYKRHLDQFKLDDHRKLSVICYLNIDWSDEDGGQLRMYLNDETKDILPLAGRLVCFRSDQIEHEVLPGLKERRSLTGWMLDQYADLRHL